MKKLLYSILFIAVLASCKDADTESIKPASETSLRELFSVSFLSDTTYTVNVDSVKLHSYSEMPVSEFTDSTMYAKNAFKLYLSANNETTTATVFYFDMSDEKQEMTYNRIDFGLFFDLQVWLPSNDFKPDGSYYFTNKEHVAFFESPDSVSAPFLNAIVTAWKSATFK